MSACLTCPISTTSQQLNQRYSAWRRRVRGLWPTLGEGLGSLSVIGLAVIVLGLATISTVAAAAAPLLSLIPEVIGTLVR